jgi:hypothetical protein
MMNNHFISVTWCIGYNDGYDTDKGELGIYSVGASFSFDEGTAAVYAVS